MDSKKEPVAPSGVVMRLPPGGINGNCEKGAKFECSQDHGVGGIRNSHPNANNEGSHHSSGGGSFQKPDGSSVSLPDVSVNLVNLRSPGREISSNTQQGSSLSNPQSQMSPGKRKKDATCSDPKKDLIQDNKMDTSDNSNARIDVHCVDMKKSASDNEDMKENKEERMEMVDKPGPAHQISSGRSTPVSGRGRRGRGRYQDRGEVMDSHTCATSGIVYEKGDCIYLDSQRADQPYFIACVYGFRKTKRENLVVDVKWYYRPSEVPDSVYQLLISDRVSEVDCGRKLAIADPVIKSRELFISDATDTYPVHALRGKCTVKHFQDVLFLKDFEPNENTFFYILGYNPETKRLATTQGEIRVGSSHQARLPELRRHVTPADMPESLEDHEELRWKPASVMDGDLIMYLRAARSMAAFAGMCDGGSTDDGCQAASMDETTINAMDTLHKTQYDTGRALQELVKRPVPRSIDKKWAEEDTKRFVKGLRQHGKNFFKIRKELLPYKETGDLVEFYYYWKKTPSAANNRPHRKHRRQNVLRRQPRTPRPPSSEYYDLSSASEVSDNDSDDSDSRDLSGYACRHCFTTSSKDWHHAGKDKALLCTECRIFFKKYGEERPVDKREPPPFMFKPVREDDSLNGKHTMRTRRSKEQGSKNRVKKERHAASSPDNVDSPTNSSASSKDIAGRKSPSTVSTCSNSSTDKDKKKSKKTNDSPLKGKKRPLDIVESEEQKRKKAQERPDSPADSSTDSSSVGGNDNDENGNEGDIENNQEDDLSSSSESTAPSPIPAEQPDGPDFKPQPQVAPPQTPREIAPEEGTANTTNNLPPQLVAPSVVTHTATPVLSAAPVAQQAALIPTSRAAAPTPPARGSPTPVLLPAAERERLLFIEKQREQLERQELERQLQESRQRQEAVQKQQQQQQQQSQQQQRPSSQPSPQQQPSQVTPHVIQPTHLSPQAELQSSLQQQSPALSQPQLDHRERDFDRHKPIDYQRELERQRELEHQRELDYRQRDFERQREIERHRELERQQHEADKQSQQLLHQPPQQAQGVPLSLQLPPGPGLAPQQQPPPHPGSSEHPQRGLISQAAPQPLVSPTANVVSTDRPREVERPQLGLPPHPNSLTTPLPPPPPLQGLGLVKGPPPTHVSTPQSLPPHPHSTPSHPTPPPPAPPLTSIKQEVIDGIPDHQHPHKPPSHRPGLSPPPPLLSQQQQQQQQQHHSQQQQQPPPAHHQHHPHHTPPPHHPLPHPSHPSLPLPHQYPPHLQSSSAPPHLLVGPPPHPHSPHLSNNHIPSSAPQIQIKQERPPTPPHARSPQQRPSSRSKSPMKTQSPTRPRSRSPLVSRSRSRSPVSSPEPERRSPSPEPRIVNEQCHTSANAIFIRRIWRGYNSCARCDIESKPLPDSKLARKREERLKRTSQHSASSAASTGPTQRPPSVPSVATKEDKRTEPTPPPPKKVEEDNKKRLETPPLNPTADAQVTSTLMTSQQLPGMYGGGNDRSTPGRMTQYPPHDPTPALRQLSEYARPHAMGQASQDPGRGMPYGMPGGPNTPGVDPMLHYRMASMYPPGSRERLELELQRDKQERDARERDLRERELRDMEFREKMKQELEMKPPGFDRLPPGATIDPHWLELQRRYGGLPPGANGPHAHMPGVYPPASLASDLIQRERERIERLGLMPPGPHLNEHASSIERLAAERLLSERMALVNDPMLRLQMAGAGLGQVSSASLGGPGLGPPTHAHTHTHAHSHTHLHLHPEQQAALSALQQGSMSHVPQQGPHPQQGALVPTGSPSLFHPHHPRHPLSAPHLLAGADPLAAAAAQGAGHQQGHPPASPHLMAAAREQEMMYRELLSRPPYSTDPVLAHQVLSAQAAQHEALQRQLALEREGLARHLPPH